MSVVAMESKVAMCSLSNHQKMSLFPDKKDCWAQIHDMLIDKDPLGQVKFVHLFKVTVLNWHVIMRWTQRLN